MEKFRAILSFSFFYYFHLVTVNSRRMTVNTTTMITDAQTRLAPFAEQRPMGFKGHAVTCADPLVACYRYPLATAVQTHLCRLPLISL